MTKYNVKILRYSAFPARGFRGEGAGPSPPAAAAATRRRAKRDAVGFAGPSQTNCKGQLGKKKGYIFGLGTGR